MVIIRLDLPPLQNMWEMTPSERQVYPVNEFYLGVVYEMFQMWFIQNDKIYRWI